MLKAINFSSRVPLGNKNETSTTLHKNFAKCLKYFRSKSEKNTKRYVFQKKISCRSSNGPVENSFNKPARTLFWRTSKLVSLKVRKNLWSYGFLRRKYFCPKNPLDTIIETILQSKNSFIAEVFLDMQNGSSIELRKNLAKCPEHFISEFEISVQVFFSQKKAVVLLNIPNDQEYIAILTTL